MKFTKLIIILFLGAAIAACGVKPTPLPATAVPPSLSPSPNPTLVAGIVGVWQGDNGSFYAFHADGTWNWDEQRGNVEDSPENTGSWFIAGEMIYITDLTGPSACPQSQVGSYRVQFESGKLVLTLVQDKCQVRFVQTAGNYSPSPINP